MYLFCHVTLHDHLIERMTNLQVRIPCAMSLPDKSYDHKNCDGGDNVFNFSNDLS